MAAPSTLCGGSGWGGPGPRVHTADLMLGAATVDTTVRLWSNGCEIFKSQNLLRSLLVMISLPGDLGSNETRPAHQKPSGLQLWELSFSE